jgi:Putative metal-binding motif/Secretion system C-terminal sorting domain
METFLQQVKEAPARMVFVLLSFLKSQKDNGEQKRTAPITFWSFFTTRLPNYSMVLVFFLVGTTLSWGQASSIWTNPITGTNPGNSNPYTTGDVKSPYITVSGIGESGLDNATGNDRYNKDDFTTNNSINTNSDYFSFTLTPIVGYHINYNSFVYTSTRQGGGTGGPTQFAFRSNAAGNNYATNIGSPNSSGTTLSLTGASYQNSTAAIQYRFYGWDADSSNGDFSINDFTFTGGILGSATTAISGFSTCLGSASSAQSFVVNGQGLSSATATITVAGSANYEVSITSATAGFASSVSFNATGGAVTRTVWVRLKASASVGAYTEDINISGGGFSVGNGIDISCSGVVNPLPTAASTSASTYSICAGNSINLFASATSNSSTAVTLLTENFNGATNNWTKLNNSTGGVPADAAWTLRPNNYNYGGNSYRSNDNSQFYFSNSDDQGTGGITSTILQSPSFSTVGLTSASLTFYHYFNSNDPLTDFARVEVSTDGSNWTNLNTYTTDQGGRTSFSLVTLSLNSYLDEATLFVRYKYDAPFGWYWAIDNVSVSGVSAVPPAPTYAWTSSPAGFVSTDQNPTNIVPTANTVYTVTITNSYGCSVQLSTPEVVVNANPTLAAVAQVATVCEGSSASFALSGLLPNTTSSVSYSINGGPVQTASGLLADGSGNASFSDVLNLVDNGQNIVISEITRTDVSPNCPVSVTISSVLSVNQNVTYYADSDGDGFGDLAVSQVSCFGAPVGYVLDSSDCDDATLRYEDLDGDGYGTTFVACGGVLLDGDCNDANDLINPVATEICYDGIDQNCDGDTNDGCPIITAQLRAENCGSTLTAINQVVRGSLLSQALPNGVTVTGYRFRVTNLLTNQVRIVDRSNYVFQLTYTDFAEYNTPYSVEVSLRLNQEWLTVYGPPCSIVTPGIPSTVLASTSCESTIAQMNSIIRAVVVPSALNYEYEVSLIEGGIPTETTTLIRTGGSFNFLMLTGISIKYGAEYSVRIKVQVPSPIGLQWSTEFGAACSIFTPVAPEALIEGCGEETGILPAAMTTLIYAVPVGGATQYRFTMTDGLGYNQTITSPIRSFRLSNFNVLSPLTPGATYSISVEAQIFGFFYAGKDCNITVPGGAPIVPFTRAVVGTDNVMGEFKAVAYPNPFENSFALDLRTSSTNPVSIAIYDMTGRLLEINEYIADSLAKQTIGERYPAGVYNVIVTQGENMQTVRVVKK